MLKVTQGGQVPHILFHKPCVGELFSLAGCIAHAKLLLLTWAVAYEYFAFAAAACFLH